MIDRRGISVETGEAPVLCVSLVLFLDDILPYFEGVRAPDAYGAWFFARILRAAALVM